MTSNSDYRFYIVGTGNDYIKFMWKDAIENDNVFIWKTQCLRSFR